MSRCALRESAEITDLVRRCLDKKPENRFADGAELQATLEQIQAVTVLLKKAGWEPVVQVKEAGEEVQIFMKADEQGMQGLTVMTVNLEEAVFINIQGDIDPAKLEVLMEQLDVNVDLE